MTRQSRSDSHAPSATSVLLDELALYGYRPGQDEPDPRPLPEAEMVQAELAGIIDAIFHRKIERLERDLDANE